MSKGLGRKRARWGEGRVAYAALAPEIAKALEEGLPMTKVYALFEARLGMSNLVSHNPRRRGIVAGEYEHADAR